MEYHNPEIPEGINTSPEHPLKEFALLLGGLLALVVLIVAGLALSAEYLAGKIPFETEQRLAGRFGLESQPPAGADIAPEPPAVAAARRRIRNYLQDLADELARAEELPARMPVTVHYLPDETINAFATLGGHLMFHRGLLEKIPDENTLAMVMAHEIAHIKLRHPVRSLGRGIVVGLALSMVSAALGDAVLDNMLGDSGLLTLLHFSRQQEAAADAEALAALARHYGHVAGSRRLFEILEAAQAGYRPPAFFSTHPVSADRIATLRQLAARHGWQEGPPRSLPIGFRDWLQASVAPAASPDAADRESAPPGNRPCPSAAPEPTPSRRCPN